MSLNNFIQLLILSLFFNSCNIKNYTDHDVDKDTEFKYFLDENIKYQLYKNEEDIPKKIMKILISRNGGRKPFFDKNKSYSGFRSCTQELIYYAQSETNEYHIIKKWNYDCGGISYRDWVLIDEKKKVIFNYDYNFNKKHIFQGLEKI